MECSSVTWNQPVGFVDSGGFAIRTPLLMGGLPHHDASPQKHSGFSENFEEGSVNPHECPWLGRSICVMTVSYRLLVAQRLAGPEGRGA